MKKWLLVSILILSLLVLSFAPMSGRRGSLIWAKNCPGLVEGEAELRVIGDRVECRRIVTPAPTLSPVPTSTPIACEPSTGEACPTEPSPTVPSPRCGTSVVCTPTPRSPTGG